MILNSALKETLFRPDNLDKVILDWIESLHKKNTATTIVSVDSLRGNLSLDRSCSGYLLSTHNGCPWTSCLMGIRQYRGDSHVYLFFPEEWVETSEVSKWCFFLKEYYKLLVTYAGVVNLDSRKYGDPRDNTVLIRSHIVVLNTQPNQDKYENFNLIKTTLIRYLFRVDHLRKIIHPLYEMVEAGIDPWDALMLAHLATDTIGGYSPGRGLAFNTSYPSLIWPRSHSDFVDYLAKYYYINNVWGGMIGMVKLILNKLLDPHVKELNFIDSATIGVCYNKVFIDEFRALCKDKKYKTARNLYFKKVKSFLPMLKVMQASKVLVTPCMNGSSKIKGNILSDVIKHLESI